MWNFFLKILILVFIPTSTNIYTYEMTIIQANKNKICIFFLVRLKKIFFKKWNYLIRRWTYVVEAVVWWFDLTHGNGIIVCKSRRTHVSKAWDSDCLSRDETGIGPCPTPRRDWPLIFCQASGAESNLSPPSIPFIPTPSTNPWKKQN